MKKRQMLIIVPLLCGLGFSGNADDEMEAMMREMAWKIPLREQERIRWDNSLPNERMARIRELSAENNETNKILLGEIFMRLPQAVPSTAGRQSEKTAAFQGLLPMFSPPIAKYFAISTLTKEIGALHAARWEGQAHRYPSDLILTAVDFLAQSPADPDVIEVLTRYAEDNWIREDVRERVQKYLPDWQSKANLTPAVTRQETDAVQGATSETKSISRKIPLPVGSNAKNTNAEDEPSEEETKASHFWLYVILFHLILFPVLYFIRRKFSRNKSDGR